MNKWKEIFFRMLFPGTFIVFLLVNSAAILLLYAFLGKNCPAAVQYFSYGFSAYALVVVCARIPRIVKSIKCSLYVNKYTGTYLKEKELRIRISLYSGLVINACFAIFKVVIGVLYQSKWLFAMAGYNMVLSVMRFVLVYRDQAMKRKEESEKECRMRGLHSYKVCGWLMLVLNIAISTIAWFVVIDDTKITYPGFMIYAIAAYAFYCLTKSIVSMVRYWHRDNPVFSAVKRIEMAKALVSIFTLQVAMLTQFGSTAEFANQVANGATGFAVCLIINVMAIFMLTGVKKDYKEMQEV